MVVLPVVFLHGLDFVEEHGRLMMQHLPREADQASACRQVKIFSFVDALRKNAQKR